MPETINVEGEMLRAMVLRVLEFPHEHDWSVQGFGMLRCYFGDGVRLNLWDDRFMVEPPPALIHDHPWDFSSFIVLGTIYNTRYYYDRDGDPHWQVLIRPGEGGGPVEHPEHCNLRAQHREFYSAGMKYHQSYDELHKTEYESGTVTVNWRNRKVDADHALSIWPVSEGDEWRSAEPRPATMREVSKATQRALEQV